MLCRHRRGHTLQISGQPGSCRRDGSPEIKAGAVQPCLTLCPAGHPQGGGRPAGAEEAREEGAGIRQRGAARGRPPPAPSPRPLTPPAPSFFQLWGVCAPTFSAVTLFLSLLAPGEGEREGSVCAGLGWSPRTPTVGEEGGTSEG